MARLIKCVRSGPKRPFAGVPATAWQFMQALLSKTRLPRWRHACVLSRGLLLCAHPRGKIFRTVHRNAQQHLGMLCSAVLRALAKKDSRALRVHPHSVRVVGNQVGLSREFRDPEAVVGIGRKQLQETSVSDDAGSLTGMCSSLAVTIPSFG